MKKLLTAIASTAFLSFFAAAPSVAQEVTFTDWPLEDMLLSDGNTYSGGTAVVENNTGGLTSVTLNGCTANLACVSEQIGAFDTGMCIAEAMGAGNNIEVGANCVINKGGSSAYYSCVSGTCPNP
ncbi:MAG: hypothetical protein F6K18_30325 [Okeania sp. SIO2C2]|uniref:hypothetical protein n=1 Tax=Okeania sp. SIO2C2 TaxID=2607787 RepID=UPI0013BB52CA|nr:hypothetical protein [Okeania sp. SIO2C2]NEP90763.1 hypothetical protein [Okeania sp. SIO2C2]